MRIEPWFKITTKEFPKEFSVTCSNEKKLKSYFKKNLKDEILTCSEIKNVEEYKKFLTIN